MYVQPRLCDERMVKGNFIVRYFWAATIRLPHDTIHIVIFA